jgi:SHS2 domain-containing protein
MRVDVKAVTLHRFSLTQSDRGWEAVVILDI